MVAVKVFLVIFAALISESCAQSGLHSRMTAKGRYFGNVLDANTINTATVTNILKSDFGVITAENSMKWDATQYTQGTFSYTNGDNIFNFCKNNNMKLRGHALVWHSQLPTWVSKITDKATLTSVMKTHITALMTRWKGAYHWDVVNEAFNEDGNLRQSVFYNVLGEEYISIAFKTARSVDPNAKLFINDYNLDTPNYSKLNGFVYYVKKWRSAGIPIDGVGTQAHLNSGAGSSFKGALDQLATIGVDVAITELDIQGASTSDFSNVVSACLNVPKCIGISLWGVRDSDSWRASEQPLLYDSSGKKKAAYTAVYNALA